MRGKQAPDGAFFYARNLGRASSDFPEQNTDKTDRLMSDNPIQTSCVPMTGAEIVLEALRDRGVEHIFGYPGAAVLPIYDEIFQQDDFKHILVRHEQGAGHAAEAMPAR
jgi:hypothetical protein